MKNGGALKYGMTEDKECLGLMLNRIGSVKNETHNTGKNK